MKNLTFFYLISLSMYFNSAFSKSFNTIESIRVKNDSAQIVLEKYFEMNGGKEIFCQKISSSFEKTSGYSSDIKNKVYIYSIEKGDKEITVYINHPSYKDQIYVSVFDGIKGNYLFLDKNFKLIEQPTPWDETEIQEKLNDIDNLDPCLNLFERKIKATYLGKVNRTFDEFENNTFYKIRIYKESDFDSDSLNYKFENFYFDVNNYNQMINEDGVLLDNTEIIETYALIYNYKNINGVMHGIDIDLFNDNYRYAKGECIKKVFNYEISDESFNIDYFLSNAKKVLKDIK